MISCDVICECSLSISQAMAQKAQETDSALSPELSPSTLQDTKERKNRKKSEPALSEETEEDAEEKTDKLDTVEAPKVSQTSLFRQCSSILV